jgi:hypothetical protein
MTSKLPGLMPLSTVKAMEGDPATSISATSIKRWMLRFIGIDSLASDGFHFGILQRKSPNRACRAWFGLFGAKVSLRQQSNRRPEHRNQAPRRESIGIIVDATGFRSEFCFYFIANLEGKLLLSSPSSVRLSADY